MDKSRNYNIDVIMQGIARVLGGVFSFFSVFILTYLFNESEIGEYNLILSIVSIIASLGTLWLSQSVLRFFDEKKDAGSVFVLIGISTMICLLIYGIVNFFLKQTNNLWVFAYVVMLVFYNVFDAIFRRSRRLLSYVALELLLAISRVFPMIVLAKVTKSYNSIFASQCIVLFIFFVIMLFAHLDDIRGLKIYVNIDMLHEYLKFGVPLLGLAISNWFLTTSDRYVIKYFGENAQVGIYSTNYSLANSIYMMFSLIIVNAFHPIIMKEWDRDKTKTLNLVSHAIDLYFMLMIPLTFYGCLKSRVLLSMFKGDLYASHSDIFIWTAIGIFFYGLSLLLHKYYELTQKTKMILLINLIAAVINVILNIILIPILGFEIAAFTTFLAYIIYILIVRILTYKVFPLEIKKKNCVIILSSLLLFYILDLVIVKNDSVLGFLVEGAIYVIYTIFVYQITNIVDLKSLKGLVKRK